MHEARRLILTPANLVPINQIEYNTRILQDAGQVFGQGGDFKIMKKARRVSLEGIVYYI